MKQVLGDKKHRKCEAIGGKSYRICYTTRSHGIAECWFGPPTATGYLRNMDLIDFKNDVRWARIREGKDMDITSPDQKELLAIEDAIEQATEVSQQRVWPG